MEEAVSFEKERTDDLGLYGLDRPAHRVTLHDGILKQELLIGNPSTAKDEE